MFDREAVAQIQESESFLSPSGGEHEGVGEAWILQLSRELPVAIGRYELKYLETDYDLIRVPGAPSYCNTCIHWQGQLIPVLEVSRLLFDPYHESESSEPERLDAELDRAGGMAGDRSGQAVSGLAIVAFDVLGGCGQRQGMALGALAVMEPPKLVSIDSAQARDLDELPVWLQGSSRASFTFRGQVLSCLSLSQLFMPFSDT